MKDWQRRLFLFGQEWLGALMLLWLRHEKDPLLGKAAIGYVLSMVLAYAVYFDVLRRALEWRRHRHVRVIGPEITARSIRADGESGPPTQPSRR